jgi:hypothetical protein
MELYDDTSRFSTPVVFSPNLIMTLHISSHIKQKAHELTPNLAGNVSIIRFF